MDTREWHVRVSAGVLDSSASELRISEASFGVCPYLMTLGRKPLRKRIIVENTACFKLHYLNQLILNASYFNFKSNQFNCCQNINGVSVSFFTIELNAALFVSLVVIVGTLNISQFQL